MAIVTRYRAPNPETLLHHGQPGESDFALRAIVSGSFDPIHAGHLRMAKLAGQLFLPADQQFSFELSRSNADKQTLDNETLARRIAQDFGGVDLVVTDAPTFADKARLTRNAIFAVGADTILRVDDPRFYRDVDHRAQELQTIADRECRFVVFGRQVQGRFVAEDDIEISDSLRCLCTFITPDQFAMNISSSDIRNRNRP